MLLGRAAERLEIDRVLRDAEAGTAQCLAFEGEPGIGKTELLAYAAAEAGAFRVLRTTGIETDADLPFAALFDLAGPVIDLIGEAPLGQAAALRAALGLEPPAQTSRFLVAAGFLSVLAAAAQRQPLLLLVDDLHWVDAASAQALLFAVRRLRAEPVSTILAYRSGEPLPVSVQGLPRTVVVGIDRSTVSDLLSENAPEIAEPVADYLHAATGGNPLAILEIVAGLSPGQRAGRERLPEPVPSVRRLDDAYSRRFDSLGEPARRALIVMAASGDVDLSVLGPALSTSGCTTADLADAVDAGLLSIDTGRARWRHPLIRSVVYHGCGSAERRAAHIALASSLPAGSPSWAWHQAEGAEGPDERIASALDRVAAEASERAGFVAAANASEHAARLSPDRAAESVRRLAAADAAWLAGDVARAERLLDESLMAAKEGELRGRLLLLRAHTEYACGETGKSAQMFEEAAGLLTETDQTAAAGALSHAALARWWSVDPHGLRCVVDRMGKLARNQPALVSMWAFFAGLEAMFCGDAAIGTAKLEQALTETPPDPGEIGDPRQFRAIAALGWLGRTSEGRALGVQRVRQLRSIGALGMLPRLLRITASQELDDDMWADAVADASEGLEVCDELGQLAHQPELWAILATVAGFRGEDEACHAQADAALEGATRHAQPWVRLIAVRAMGILALGRGDLVAATSLFEQVVAVPLARGLRGPTVLSLPDLVEVLVRSGSLEPARRRADEFERRVENMADKRVPALVLRCRALVGEGTQARKHFVAALEHHADDPDAFVGARTRLLYGEYLRRVGERRAARAELASALEVFDAYGAKPWAVRARAELRSSGATLRSRPDADTALTGAELRVALLAADGLTTKEISGQLYLSNKTVEFHLGRVYRKLSVRSRTELARRLPGRTDAHSGVP